MTEKALEPSSLSFAQRRILFEAQSSSEMAASSPPRRSAVVLSQTSTLVIPSAPASSSRALEQRAAITTTERRPSTVTAALISPVIPKLQSELHSPNISTLVSPLIHASIPPVIRSPSLLHQSSPKIVAQLPHVRRPSIHAVADGKFQSSSLQPTTIPNSSSQGNAPAVTVRRTLVVPSPTLTSLASPHIGMTEASTSIAKAVPISSRSPARSPQVISPFTHISEAEDDFFFELPPPVVGLDEDETFGAEGLVRTESTTSKRWHEESDDGSDDGIDIQNADPSQDDSMVRTPNGMRWVKAEKRYALDCSYSIWFQHAQHAKKKPKSEQQYEEGLNCIGTFNSVQDYWRYWNAIDLQKMPNFCSLSVFKHPIKPMWEDPHNKQGGQWVIRCVDRALTADYFTKVALALIGGYFECHEDLCGVVLTMKPKFNSIGLWNCQVEPAAVEPVLQEMRELLNLENGDRTVSMEYKEHGGSIVSNCVKLGETDAPKLIDLNLGSLRLAPTWKKTPTKSAAESLGVADVASSSVAVVMREAVPASRTNLATPPTSSSSVVASSGSTLKASAAPFTFTAAATDTYNGYESRCASSTGVYRYNQNATNGSQFDNYYAGGYAYYDSGEYHSSGNYFPTSNGTGEGRLWT